MRPGLTILSRLQLLVIRMNSYNDELQQDITDLENGDRNIRIVHSSKIAIGEVMQDILYNIFTLAVCSSGENMTTALAISHVCSRWRNCALGWPVLWTFINLNATPRLVDLFMSRSENAPITLSLTEWTPQCTSLEHLGSIRHRTRIVDLNHILPRLCSLTLRLSPHPADFARIQRLFQNSKVSPLQLRHLDVSMEFSTQWRPYPPLTDLLCIDHSCLRELKLERTDLPWHELLHRGLTHFNLSCPTDPPGLSQLVSFLAGCPLLYELELHFLGNCDNKVDIIMTKLDFPNLGRLVLRSRDTSSYIYIRELSAHIQIGSSLSEFHLHFHTNRVHPFSDPTKFNVFDSIPSGVLSRFIGHNHLYIGINFYCGSFDISTAPGSTHTPPLRIVGSFPLGLNSFDHLSPILDLIHDMHNVTYLALRSQALELPWITDMPSLFPSLDILELDSSCSVLNLVPANLNLQRLILTGTMSDLVSADNLLDVVSRTGVKLLELRNIECNEEADRIVETALRQLRESGVTVIRSD